jgi:hypothetical protein
MADYKISTLLTGHDHPHILDETVDDLESLRCGSPSLVLRESVNSLQDRFDVLLSFLEEFDCIVLSKAKRPSQREQTHSIVSV